LKFTGLSLLVFACSFGAALVAMAIGHRLPSHHVSSDSRDVVKLVLGLVATLTALVLGLLISSAHSAYDAQEAELQQLSVHVYELDRILSRFGADANNDRDQLRRIVAGDIARIWPSDGVGGATFAPLAAHQEAEMLVEGIGSLSPKTDIQRFAQNRAMQLIISIGEIRRLLAEQAQGGLPLPFFVVLMSWLTVLFFGFGLFAKFNGTVVAALFVGSASVAGAIILILGMNQPYSGWLQLSSAPLQGVLAQIGR